MKLAALAALCACTVDVRIDRDPGDPDAAADAAVIDALLACLALVFSGCGTRGNTNDNKPAPSKEASMQIQYLEIVTPDVPAVCATYAKLYGVTFTEPVPELGNARTADLPDGGKLGVRAPLRDSEDPVVRPYLLVDDIEASVKAAEVAGAVIAHPAMEIPGHGTFAIFIQGGVEHGLWQR